MPLPPSRLPSIIVGTLASSLTMSEPPPLLTVIEAIVAPGQVAVFALTSLQSPVASIPAVSVTR